MGRRCRGAGHGEEVQRRGPWGGGEEGRRRLRVVVAQQRGGRGGGGVHARGVSLVQQVVARPLGQLGVGGAHSLIDLLLDLVRVRLRGRLRVRLRLRLLLLDLRFDLRGAGGLVYTAAVAAAAAGWLGGCGRVQAGAGGCGRGTGLTCGPSPRSCTLIVRCTCSRQRSSEISSHHCVPSTAIRSVSTGNSVEYL